MPDFCIAGSSPPVATIHFSNLINRPCAGYLLHVQGKCCGWGAGVEEVEYHRDMLAGKGINRTGWDWLKPLKSDPSGYAAHPGHNASCRGGCEKLQLAALP
jgi:hypothetical protein